MIVPSASTEETTTLFCASPVRSLDIPERYRDRYPVPSGGNAQFRDVYLAWLPMACRYPVDMQIQDEAIREYIEIHKLDCGEDLTMEEAREITARLIALYEVLLRPLSSIDAKRLGAAEENHNHRPSI